MTDTLTPAPILILRATGGREVTVRRERVPFGYHETIRPAFVVATTTGYRATLPECLRDDCAAGTVKPCALQRGHGKGIKGANGCDGSDSLHHPRWGATTAHTPHCHKWHEPSVARFAADVLASYGYKLPKVPQGVPSPGMARSKYRPGDYAKVSTLLL